MRKLHPDFSRVTESGIAKLCREYTDVNGQRRRLIYDHEGPAGSRWITEDGSMITVDYYGTREMIRVFNEKYKERHFFKNPWDNARDIKDSWVMGS